MNCAASCVKYILYIFNIIFLICGVLLIVLGSLMLGNMGSFKSFDEAVNMEIIPILIIVLGCIIFIISFFGCCGAIMDNSCLLITYSICMFIVLALQIALVVWMFVQQSSFLKTMSSVVDSAWKTNDDTHGYPMDALQLSFKCCGLNSYSDYTTAVPASCCGYVDRLTECPASTYESRPGCQAKFVDFWKDNTNIIRWAGIGVAIIEFIVFIFACCLASSVRGGGNHNL